MHGGVGDGLGRPRLAYGLSEKHSLFGPQLELLGCVLLVAIVEPGRQTLRGGEQINVRSGETRGDKIVGFLDLRIRDAGGYLMASISTLSIIPAADISLPPPMI